MKYEFWRDWKNLNQIEKRAIKSIRKAKKILFENVPKESILAIYIKGSFARREMNKKSDVDIVPVVKDNKLLSKIIRIDKSKRNLYSPSELLPHSVWELKNNKRYFNRGDTGPKGSPDLFTKNLNKMKLIYGKPIDINSFKIREDKEQLRGLIKAFSNIFLPYYKEKKFSFTQISKQVFWLADLEQKVKGKNPPPHWKKLAKSIKDKNHIIHETLRHRLNPTKDKRFRAKYIVKLKKYLRELKVLYK